jgi:drug/metabolite transporter (DMT)-like permease
MVIGLGAALLAAVLFGVAAVVQAIAARRHGLVSWMMAGVAAVYVLGWLLHLVAIAYVPLYVAQVGIAAALVVTALLAATVVGEPLAPRHWVAIAAMFAGLVLLVLAAGPVGSTHFETEHTLVLYAGAALTLGLGLVVRRFSGEASGVALGALAGIAYGGSPISTRALVDPHLDAETIVPALTIGIYGLLGFWLCSIALRRAAVTAVNAPLILLETVVPAVVGITVFDDQVRAGWWPVALTGFALSTLGALVLCGAETRLEQVEQPGSAPVTEQATGQVTGQVTG